MACEKQASIDKDLQVSENAGAAQGAADDPKHTADDADFQKLANAWPTLPQPLKAAIMAIVNASDAESD